MPRLPRFAIPGQPQHIIQRGDNRKNIFRSKDDYPFYLEKLGEAADKYSCDIHAYVLMPNHLHLLLTPREENSISKVMQSVGRCYTQYFNDRYNRAGALWEGRYKATLIDSEQYLLTCMRYIELNPVRAPQKVKHPADYLWSSYRHNALGEDNPLITAHKEYKRLAKEVTARPAAYRELFRTRIPELTLEALRDATNKAWVLGSDRFKRRMEKQLDRAVESAGHGGDRKSVAYRKDHAV
ncbi:MAG: transposase [Gammaproteobacteria bacterium]|nr:transposase [Gammaproteobacteria bacterium]